MINVCKHVYIGSLLFTYFYVHRRIEQIYVAELNGTNRRTFIGREDNVSYPFALASDSLRRYVVCDYVFDK